MRKAIQSLLATDGRVWFAVVCLVYIADTYVNRHAILTRELYHKALAERLTDARIDELLNLSSKYIWVAYLSPLVTVPAKAAFSAVCLNVGALLLRYPVRFRDVFQLAVIAEVCRCVSEVWKTIHFLYVVRADSLREIAWYQPLSLSRFLQSAPSQDWLAYPAQFLSAFELLYALVLALGFSVLIQRSFTRGLAVTAGTYGLGLLTWVSFVVFLLIAGS